MPCDESWIYCYNPESKRQSSQWKCAGSPRLKKTKQNKSIPKLLMIPFFSFLFFFFFFFFFWHHWHDLHALGSHCIDSQQGILCWSFKGVHEEIWLEETSTLQIGSVAFPLGQCTSPQLHLCHRLFDQDGHQDTCSASQSPDLAPCDFWLFPKLRGCRYETIEEWWSCDEGHWYAHTRGLPWGIPEVVGTLQVHLRPEEITSFHVCTINKSAHTKNVWKLIKGTSYLE